jgi:DNA-binding NtrC family response regulator
VKILIVDDQRSARRVLRQMLAPMPGTTVVEADSVESALAIVESESPDLLLLDVRLSEDVRDRGGLEVLRRVRASGKTTPAVMVTTLSETADIRQAMRLGAQDYVLKDELEAETLLPILEGFRERLRLRDEVHVLRQQVDRSYGLGALVGSSPAMERVRGVVRRVAEANAMVLVRGETGTGKELVARALHQLSSRASHPFVAINCATFPGQLMESLLFGHERGAFTGAERKQRGQLELAGQGTVLLDEIAEMPQELQAKLLRVLEDRRFRPVGAEQEVPLRARVLAATHVDIEQRILDGRFRQDLYYRLAVVTIALPTLAERSEDVPELLTSFLSELSRPLRFTDDAVAWLARRRFPGNVRELRNLVERLALLAEGPLIDVPTLRELAGEQIVDPTGEVERLARLILSLPDRMGSKLRVMEKAILHHAIETCGGNKTAAARLVGVDRKALERRWARLDDAPASVPRALDEDEDDEPR